MNARGVRSEDVAGHPRQRTFVGMDYVFQFGDVWAARWDLLWGSWLTIQLSAAAMALGLLVAVLCALGKTMGPKPIRWAVDCYIEVIRNTPFLVQIFLVFFGLSSLGLTLSAFLVAIIALTINVGAYTGEIMRAGFESVHAGQSEAAECLGMSRFQVYWHVVLRPAVERVYPSLTSQFILLMLSSAVVSTIPADDLTSPLPTICRHAPFAASRSTSWWR